MKHDTSSTHPSAERIQALLEGDLPRRERSRIEEHVASCARCAAEVDAWKALFRSLEGLPALAPHEDFAQRVMVRVQIPAGQQEVPWAARVGRWIRIVQGRGARGHVPEEALVRFLEGALTPRMEARVQEHLDECPACSTTAAEWRPVLGALDGLGHLAPTDGFADAVMARVRLSAVPARAAAAPTAASSRLAARVRALGRGLVPQTRQAWAALSGVAVTPMATLGLLLYTVFSHPTVTPSTLMAFVSWKATEAVQALLAGAESVLIESAGVFQLYGILESLATEPGLLVGGLVTAATAMGASAWVLYKYLIAAPRAETRHVRVSHS